MDSVEDGGIGNPRQLRQNGYRYNGKAETSEGLDKGGETHADSDRKSRASDEGTNERNEGFMRWGRGSLKGGRELERGREKRKQSS